MEDNRLKRVFLDPNNLVRVLNWLHAPGDSCLVVGGPHVPEGATVHSCYYDQSHRGLIVVLSHPRFDPVPAGEETPWLSGARTTNRLVIRKPEKALSNVEVFRSNEARTKAQNERTFPRIIIADLMSESASAAARDLHRQATLDARKTIPAAPDGDEEESSVDWFQRVMGPG